MANNKVTFRPCYLLVQRRSKMGKDRGVLFHLQQGKN